MTAEAAASATVAGTDWDWKARQDRLDPPGHPDLKDRRGLRVPGTVQDCPALRVTPDPRDRKDRKANRGLPVMRVKQVSSLHLRKLRVQTARTAGRRSKSVSTPITTACWTRQKFQTHITHATASRVCKALKETRGRKVQQGLKDHREFRVTLDPQGHKVRRVIKVLRECRVMPGHRGRKVCKVTLDPRDRRVRRVIEVRKEIPVSMDSRV